MEETNFSVSFYNRVYRHTRFREMAPRSQLVVHFGLGFGFSCLFLPPLLHADAKQLPDATKQSLVYSHVYRHTRFRALVLSSQLIVHYALSFLCPFSYTQMQNN